MLITGNNAAIALARKTHSILNSYVISEHAVATNICSKVIIPYIIKHPNSKTAWFQLPDSMPTQELLNLKVKGFYPRKGVTEICFYNFDQVVWLPESIKVVPHHIDITIQGNTLTIKRAGITPIEEYLLL